MSTILEALAVIKGKDATGGAFDAVAAKIQRLARAANALNRDVNKQMATASRAEASASRLSRGSIAIGNGARMAAGALATYEGSRAVHAIAAHTVKAAADRGHEEARMAASGMSATEIKEAGELAANISSKYKSLSQTEMMHTARNIRAVVGTFEEATKILEPLAQLRVVALGAHPEKAAELNEDFDKLVKGSEIKGITQDTPRFKAAMNLMAKALNVFGDTLRPTDFYETVKYSRQAAVPLSDKFMLETAPTLAQEMGGSSTGKSLSTFYGTVIGGKMKDVAAKEFVKFGLADPSKIVYTKTGAVKGLMPNGIAQGRLASSDPYAWVNDVMLPAMAAKGVTDPKDIQDHIATMFRDTTAAQMVSIFATQQKRIMKDWELVHEAKGLDAADDFQKNDPKVIRKSVDSQVDNLLGNTAAPFLPMTNAGMNWLASGLSYMSGEASKNPLRSAAGLGWGAALMGALGIDSTTSAFGAAGSLFRGEGAGAGIKFGLTKLTAALAPILDIATRSDILAPSSKLARLAGLHADKFDALRDIDDSDKAGAINGVGDPVYQAQLKAMNDAKRAKVESDLTDLGFAGPGVPGRGQMNYSIDDIRKATGMGGGGGEPVKAEVVGNATLDVKVEVSPSADFLARVTQTVNNGINAFRASGGPASGSAGSTGQSMPEAGPPQ